MYKEAIVLAGGRGSRLQEIVADKPKPMAEINGKPFLEYLINYLGKNKIEHIILSVGYKAEQIIDYFGNRFNNIEISYAVEHIPLGTGGGILKSIEKVENNEVFIVNGDTLFNIDLQQLALFHRQNNASLSIALRKIEDGARYGSILINRKGRIKAFKEKMNETKNVLINGGTYLISKSILVQNQFPSKFSFEKDFIEKYYENENFFGMEFKDYFIDIGLPSTYNQAQYDFLNEIQCK